MHEGPLSLQILTDSVVLTDPGVLLGQGISDASLLECLPIPSVSGPTVVVAPSDSDVPLVLQLMDVLVSILVDSQECVQSSADIQPDRPFSSLSVSSYFIGLCRYRLALSIATVLSNSLDVTENRYQYSMI